MNPVTHSENRHSIVYDADRIPEPDLCLFDPGYWVKNEAVTGLSVGRGTTLMLETSFGPAVLRTYLRGGWAARLSRDRYFYSGFRSSRPFREFTILQQLAALGLPSPVPLAACCIRGSLSYRGALIMDQIMHVRPLAELLGGPGPTAEIWPAVGACVRRFHEAGVDHADLNAGNLLVDREGLQVYLVDFDRCTISVGKKINGRANLARLKRSIFKLWPREDSATLAQCWQATLDGYHA
jgi:3-deoxy-D-manno-octulosonic acid kinase